MRSAGTRAAGFISARRGHGDVRGRLIGGGDAKLFAGAALWLGLNALYEYALIVTLLGGVLSLALLTLRRTPLPPSLLVRPWIARLADRRSGIPYGLHWRWRRWSFFWIRHLPSC